MIKINGEEKELSSEIILEKLLEINKFDTSRIAVIVNDDIVPKDIYKEKVIKDGDSIEVVSFVGGG
ncbi:sulfur carrier protein ThiS [Clostridium sp. HCP1S3_B4]|uniref:sulfur carrier protein ThiS n=1 Tax=unclassified Clostridium TaxID=2614128 RepID=UPI0016A4FD53|nr:sulfur carrier protein ThiS [Clostridiales bacterium]MDY2730210.1 sulfur carrier protein ThiS [Clostridium sp.]NLK22994.1 sulfur carrier protein ThiS [Clostridiales bacterium]